MTIKLVKKRDGRLVAFDQGKIADAIFAAAQAVGGTDRERSEEIAGQVTDKLAERFGDTVPDIESIQDTVERVLVENKHYRTVRAYILYRDRRSESRARTQVRKQLKQNRSSTDMLLLVDPSSRAEFAGWDKSRIIDALITEAGLTEDEASPIASAVERRVLSSGLNRISTSLIRELVDNELFEQGYTNTLNRQVSIGMPKYDVEQLIYSKSKENSNITANNPEAINLSIAENTLKQYALQEVYSSEVADSHRRGEVHIHDLGYPTRVYCSSHSLEYLKKYGLHLENLDTSSAPAKHARTLTGHLNTFLASMQAYYAGALGVAYVNIMYAPYLEGMDDKQLKQEAQHLIFSSSQNAFSRGGQTLFLDFNIHTGVPRYLQTVPAIGPSGKYTGKTYGDYQSIATRFTKAMLDVWREGDQYGSLFAFPKCDFHINDDTFKIPEQRELFEYACQIASENGVPYFIFDRDEVTLSACCRLRTRVDDRYMIEHPESMRFCGFQNVTINMPQAAFRAGRGNIKGFLQELEDMLDICVKAHIQKREFIRHLMHSPSMPLWQVGKIAADGRPYIDLDTATYIVGVIGLNEALVHLTGKELHESEESFRQGLKIIAHLYFAIKERGEKHGMKFSLEESPAESAARRLAKMDLTRFPEEAAAVARGNVEHSPYYTNSIHLRPDADVDLITRIRLQSKFHSAIESGAIIHAFVGEDRPDAASIARLVKKTFESTEGAQLTISPEFTMCAWCKRMSVGTRDECSYCGGRDMKGVERLREVSCCSGWNLEALESMVAAGRD